MKLEMRGRGQRVDRAA